MSRSGNPQPSRRPGPRLPRGGLLLLIGPGILTAATGVGAGDLATAGFAGSQLGTAILWAVVLGAFLKFVLTEGLTRWQLATGTTILEGAVTRLGPVASIGFVVYLLPWTFFTAAALMSACGITASAILPIFDDSQHDIFLYGALHSVVGVLLVWWGGYRLIERIMTVCIGVMVVAVVVTAVMLKPDVGAILRGLTLPSIPDFSNGGLTWTIGLLGGVGGTLTILCYGYWIKERGRTTTDSLRLCRWDIASGYMMTALFGIALVIIASGMTLDAKGSRLIVELSARLDAELGPAGGWTFRIGAWAAVFSSLLGVWQAVPYIVADFVRLQQRTTGQAVSPHDLNDEFDASAQPVASTSADRTRTYRLFLLAMAVIPLLQVVGDFKTVQKYYAVIGAAFIPLLAIVLLVLNGNAKWIGTENRNRWWTAAALVLTVVLAGLAAYFDVRNRLG